MVRPRALSRGPACSGGVCDRVAVDVCVAAATVQTEPSLERPNWRAVARGIGPTAVPQRSSSPVGTTPTRSRSTLPARQLGAALGSRHAHPGDRSGWCAQVAAADQAPELPTGRGCSAPSSSPATRSTGMHCHIQLRPVSTDSWSSRRTCFAASRALCSCSSRSPGLAAPRVRLRRDLRRRFVDRGDDRECWLGVSV